MAAGDADFGRLGRALLDIVREIGQFGGFAEAFRKDCTDLARRIQLLSHLLEEIQDFKGRSSLVSAVAAAATCSSYSSSAFSSLSDLRPALEAAKNVLLLARPARDALIDFVGKKIALQFQFVTWQLEKVLRGMPYDYFDISDEVREQVELVCAQLRRATERKGSLNSKLLTDISYVLSQTHGVDPQVLCTVRENFQTENTGSSDNDFRMIVDTIAEVYGKSGRRMENRRSLLDRLIHSSLSDSCTIGETGCRSDIITDTTMKDVKKPDSPTIPDDFRCPISLELMRDPVIVSTGQTYERSFIQRWIDCGNKTCPKTQQKLENLTLTPNYVLRSLIRQWCETNQIEQPLGLSGSRVRNNNGFNQEMIEERTIIDGLVHKLSSRSIDDQRNAASEIRLLAKRSTDNRILIAEAGAIPLLVKLLSIDDLRTQENAVTALLNLSIYENNKGLITLAGAVPPIVEVLKRGSMEARENAAATLFSLSLIDENKITIGASGAIKALVELLQRGSTRGKKDAATALFNLCIYQGNKTRAVRAGILDPLMQMLTNTSDSMVDEALTILSVLASHQEGKIAIARANAIPVLIDLLRSGLPRNKENAAGILLALCKKDVENLACIGRLGAIVPLMELARSGTERAKRKASALLEHVAKMKQM
ncbi:U-box domain-containing protein 10-like [Aristolochia californica]|uniref:U-box domain-containing protein 10-like n=1 Tax=Aristolochia californica TaxID=171875 RepID=UPI0035DD4352